MQIIPPIQLSMFSNLDVVEVLKLGGIGLGFLIALLAYLIIRNEQKREYMRKGVLLFMGMFMVFAMGILVFVVVSDPNRPGGASLKLGGNPLALFDPSIAVAGDLTASEYFIDSRLGIAFRKPGSKWSEVKSGKGMRDVLRLSGLEVDIHAAEKAMQNNALGNLLWNAEYMYFDLPNSQTRVYATDSTSTSLSRSLVEDYEKSYTFDVFKSNFPDSVLAAYSEDSLQYFYRFQKALNMHQYRQELVGFDSLDVAERFLVLVYDKKLLPPALSNMSLPSFANILISTQGLNVDELIATQKSIMYGTSISIDHVMFKNKPTTVDIVHAGYVTESEDHFYLVEISHCSQLESNVRTWEELQKILYSLTIIGH
ncbi:MAG: hypothetical protein H6585_07530 [Flavobacteriales bacterium]|nr:hypothetical protein [Flavobacteriales bacterium]MCB9448177.1 hypothetical protein [Flavobacteriales bacterium]